MGYIPVIVLCFCVLFLTVVAFVEQAKVTYYRRSWVELGNKYHQMEQEYLVHLNSTTERTGALEKVESLHNQIPEEWRFQFAKLSSGTYLVSRRLFDWEGKKVEERIYTCKNGYELVWTAYRFEDTTIIDKPSGKGFPNPCCKFYFSILNHQREYEARERVKKRFAEYWKSPGLDSVDKFVGSPVFMTRPVTT